MSDGFVPHLPDAAVELVARRFRALGEPTRVRLLDALRGGSMTVQELTEATGGSQQNTSKHLLLLHGAGILRREKRGASVVYSISDPVVFELCDLVCGALRRQISDLDRALAQAQ